MKGVDAVKQIPDRSLDFIYLDARHDYCAVKEDMECNKQTNKTNKK